MKTTWLDDIVDVMMAKRRWRLAEIENEIVHRPERNIHEPRRTISRVLQTFSPDARDFKLGTPEIFRSSEGLGRGVWEIIGWPKSPDLSFQEWAPGNHMEEFVYGFVLKRKWQKAGRHAGDYNRTQIQKQIDEALMNLKIKEVAERWEGQIKNVSATLNTGAMPA
jgi:hypothetical protein